MKEVLHLLTDRKFLVTVFVFGVIFMTLHRVFYGKPDSTADLQNIVIGFILGQAFPYVLKFWFPSSEESEKKNETINELAKAKKEGE